MLCILNFCCVAMPVSRGHSTRLMPTYERPTSYYCLAGKMAFPNSNALFSPDGLIVTEMVNLLLGSIQLNVQRVTREACVHA